MSECVVRMEMPKDKNCLLNFSLPKIGPWCWIEDRACDYYKTNNRPKWCPIICQLPEGHGRLVDADANFLGVIHLDGGGFANYNTTIAKSIGEEDMRMVKVIIPAEAERSE